MKRLLILSLIPFLLFGCSQRAAPDTSADVKALSDYICAPIWNIPGADLEGVLGKYFGDDVIVYWPGRAPLTKNEIMETSKGMATDPNFTFTGTTTNLEVAKSGDIAYCSGAYKTTASDAAQNTVTDTGYWETVFKKHDGAWKAITDIHAPDHP